MQTSLFARPPLWGLLIAIAIGAMAAQPYLLGHLGQGSDTNYHAHRLWQVAQMIRDGYIFSRWTPDLAYGYGMPLFNAHGPLPYYLAVPFVLLTGQVFLGHLLALIAFSIAVGITAYLWLRDHFGEWGGLVGSAAFVFAAYPMSNVGIRGTLGEPVAYVTLPLIVWAMERMLAGQRKFVWLGALSYAALALNHNITLLIFTPALLLYGAVLVLFSVQGRARWVGAAWVALMLMWGMALSTFYVAPAFLERNDLTLDRIFAVPGFDYHFNFISLQWLFANPAPVDVNQLGTPYPEHIGATTLLLALLALLVFVRPHRHIIIRVIASALIVLLCVLMMLPQAVGIWDALPILRLLQHARRFLPLASLWMALLVAAGVCSVLTIFKHRLVQVLLPVLAVGALAVTAFPLQLNQGFIPLNTPLTAAIVMQREESAREIGTTSTGEYLPAANKKIPTSAQSPLLRGGQRLDPQSLPADAAILRKDYQPLSYDVTLQSASAFTPVFNTFVYPGWSVWVDGAPAVLVPSQPYGFMQVPLPAGLHRVQIEWGSTPLRRACEAVSILAGLLWLGTGVVFVLRKRTRQRELIPDRVPSSAIATLLAIFAIFAFKSLVVDGASESPWRNSRFDGVRIKDLANPIAINFGGHLVLLGAEPNTPVPSGGTLATTLYWRVPQKTSADYSTSLQLVDANGIVFGVSNYQHPGGPPTGVATSWMLPSQYLPEIHKLRVYPGTPPGNYSLRVQVFPYDQFTGDAVPVLDAAGAIAAVSYSVGTVTVTRPAAPAEVSDLRVSHLLTASVSSNSPIQLIGFDALPRSTRTGDRLPLNLYWRARTALPNAAQFKLRFVAANGTVVETSPAPLVEGYATNEWQAGDVWRSTNAVRVPPRLGTGPHTLSIQIDSELAIELGRIDVEAPARVMALPAVAITQPAQFGDIIALAGYSITREAKAGQPFALNLVWQSLAETGTSYKVFVHFVDAAGKLVASDDAIPAQWQRPTPGWLAGEYVTDAHTLNLPADLAPGAYTLRVGLYEEGGAGQRLALASGEQFVVLSQAVQVAR